MFRFSARRGDALGSHARGAESRVRIWMTVNIFLLASLTMLVIHTSGRIAAATASTAAQAHASAGANASITGHTGTTIATNIPSKAQILATQGKYFGVAEPGMPWSSSAGTQLAQTAGVPPDMVEYFVNWTQDFSAVPVQDAYAQGMLPVLTWEPSPGGNAHTTQVNFPEYSLSTIINGSHDAYIVKFADAVRDAKWPVAIRLAHEMNGNWYPWCEGVNGNTAGQYVEAWRHIHDVFSREHADNVIWVWAPNIIRSASTPMAELYPGDAYVDWIGLSAYDVTEHTATQLIEPTLRLIRAFTAKPLLITELGSQPSASKAAWTADFLSWLPKQSDVIGFIWFEYTRAQGAGTDWGFDTDTETLASFRLGIQPIKLVVLPLE
ncbi:MAG TPA: glycosyl hydrolase [Actinocrinis sp.]|nr:glycosyl hydrolase [Actinocrinis sp.]